MNGDYSTWFEIATPVVETVLGFDGCAVDIHVMMDMRMKMVVQQTGRIDGQHPRMMRWMVEQCVMNVLDRMLENVVV